MGVQNFRLLNLVNDLLSMKLTKPFATGIYIREAFTC
jgi:hypothetical protein